MRDFPSKTDNVSTLLADEANSFFVELENVVTSSGQALSSSVSNQLAKAASTMAGIASSFSCSNSGNAYTLSPLSGFPSLSAYRTGMTLWFKPSASNTGTATVAVSGLGTKSLLASDGSTALSSGDLPSGVDCEIFYDGTVFRLISVGFSAPAAAVSTTLPHFTPSGRLSLQSGIPSPTGDISSSSTVYYTPFNGKSILLYNGSSWDNLDFAEVSIALPATTSTLYDVFAYSSGGNVTLQLVAWSTTTSRATALTTVNGVYVKSGDTGKRYLGTVATGPSSGLSRWTSSSCLLWNMYNRIPSKVGTTLSSPSTFLATGTLASLNSDTTIGSARFEAIFGLQDSAILGQLQGLIYKDDTTSPGNTSPANYVSTLSTDPTWHSGTPVEAFPEISLGLNSTSTRISNGAIIGRHVHAYAAEHAALMPGFPGTSTAVFGTSSQSLGYNYFQLLAKGEYEKFVTPITASIFVEV